MWLTPKPFSPGTARARCFFERPYFWRGRAKFWRDAANRILLLGTCCYELRYVAKTAQDYDLV